MTVTIDNAIYDWWAQPLAVNDGAATWIGSIARLGTVRVWKVSGGTATEARLAKIKPDEHSTPALAFEPGQPDVLAFFCGHDSSNVMRYNRINRATVAVCPEQRLTFSNRISYAQVLRLGSRLVVLTRVASSSWRYMVSHDFGGTWSAERTLVTAPGLGQIYITTKPVPGVANDNHLALYGHPTSSPYRSIEYARIRLDSGSISRADGTMAGDLYFWGGPSLALGALGVAYTPPEGWKVRLLDVGTVDGAPAIVFALWEGSTGPAAYRVVRFDGGAWQDVGWSLPSGEPFGYTPAVHYIGGASIGRNDRVFTSRQDDTGVWRVEEWAWDGDTFALASEIANDAVRPLVRPYVPARSGATDVVWLRLDRYDGYSSYDADVVIP